MLQIFYDVIVLIFCYYYTVIIQITLQVFNIQILFNTYQLDIIVTELVENL